MDIVAGVALGQALPPIVTAESESTGAVLRGVGVPTGPVVDGVSLMT
ncbi:MULTISPECIES: hypothetical protein [Streptomyces]|nr:hypothetical protein [Streptomyces kasugaensis]